jgi:hypothetical protein
MSSEDDIDKDRAYRYKNILAHPLFCQHGGGCLWTPPIDRLYARIKRTTLFRQGAYIEEVTGQGKTCAMEMIQKQLLVDFEGLACVSFNAKTNRFPAPRGFYKEFLSRMGYPKLTGDTWDVRARATKKLEESAVQSPWGSVWLWIDEAQALNSDEFLFLRDLQNDLRKVEADLIVILTGEEPALSERLDQVKWNHSRSVPDRFAVERLKLDGYNVADLQALLAEMDRAEWPQNSGITWTQFFFPKAFEAGFRALSQADSCMGALADAKLLRGDDTCQARLLRHVLERFFLDNAQYDTSKMVIPVAAWENAVGDAKCQ